MNLDFSYLQVPSSLYARQPRGSEAYYQRKGKVKRKFFYNVPFTSRQMKQIQKLKQYAEKNLQNVECRREQILRYLYSSEFNFKQCLEKINIFLQWIHNPMIQSISSKASKILSDGIIYTYGRDFHDRPIVYLNLGSIDLKTYHLNDYFSAFNAVMTIVVKYLFVKGVVEKYCFVIDIGGKSLIGISLDDILTVIKKLSVVYANFLGIMLITNSSSFIKMSYFTIKQFIHEETVNNIHIFGPNQLQSIKKYVDSFQLEKRYGGSLENLQSYWPPQVPGKSPQFSEEETIYHSMIDENSVFWDDQTASSQQKRELCCDDYSCCIY